MELDEIMYDLDDASAGAVATITLDRPDVLNAISGRSGGMRDQILDALAGAEADPAVGCVVVRGNGSAFCGGGDVTGNARRETVDDHRRFLEAATRFHERLTASAVPTIAAVHGWCLGAGVLLATACDLVVAGEGARFGFPEGRIGLVGASVLTPVIGRQWAKFLMLTGEPITADQARAIGLVFDVEPDDDVHERALDLARRIALMPRDSGRSNRRAIDAVADAAGDAAARETAIVADAATLEVADGARAPDGRPFRSILDAEGVAGLKRARAAQWTQPWLRPSHQPGGAR